MNVSRWLIVLLAAVLVGCGITPVAPVARVGDVVLTRDELDKRVKLAQEELTKNPAMAQGQVPTAQKIEAQMVEMFVQQNMLLKLARDRKVEVDESAIDKQITDFDQNFKSQGGTTLDQAVRATFGLPDAKDASFRQFVASLLVQEKLAATLVTTDAVKAEIQAKVEEEAKTEVQKADVQHILVATEEEANKVLERLNAGETFESLAAELSTDPGSKDNGGKYEDIEPGMFVPEFDKAMFEDLKPGETSKPVKTEFGYHIIRLIDRTKGPRIPADQIPAQVDAAVAQQLPARQQEALMKLVDEEREKAKQDGTLIEPVYPTEVPFSVNPVPEGQPAPGATATP